MPLSELAGQGWMQIAELAIAFALSALIGLEREVRQKSAGLRTYTIVGFASALIMLVSKYGFMDNLSPYRVVVDPSRVAAQIVSGIGFIGGGVIFVRGDAVKGLTTAASVWLVAAVGMACGAGLPILAVVVTLGHFLTVFGFPHLMRRLPRSRWASFPLTVSYEDGRGILRRVLVTCTHHGFSISNVHIGKSVQQIIGKARHQEDDGAFRQELPTVTVVMNIFGARSLAPVMESLTAIDGVVSVKSGPEEGDE